MDNKSSKDTTYTYLAHAKFNWNWDQHKYKSKEWVNGAWKYIYNTTNKAKNTVSNVAQNVAKNTVNTAKNVSSTVSNTATNTAKNVYKVASNTAQNVTNAAANTANKAKEEIKEKVSETASATKDKLEEQKKKIEQTKEEAKNEVANRTSKDKTYNALPAAAVLAIGLAAYVTTLMTLKIVYTIAELIEENNELSNLYKKYNNDNKEQIQAAKSDNSKSKVENISDSEKDEMQSKCNPNYDTGEYGYRQNCYSCVLAYDLQRRGYESEAIYDENGATTYEILKCYEDAKYVDIAPSNPKKGFTQEESEKFISEFKNTYPDGSYGNFLVSWKPPITLSGHALMWEIQDGEMIIRDCQSNETYTEDQIPKLLKKVSYTEYFRTDNINIDVAHMNSYTQTADLLKDEKEIA